MLDGKGGGGPPTTRLGQSPEQCKHEGETEDYNTDSFNLSIWYFVPSEKERVSIWKIQTERFGLECTDLPDDTGWVGSDIRNCCQTAYMLNTSLRDAAQWITLVGRTARADIERLREMSENLGFLSANQAGVYRRSKEINGRSIKLQDKRSRWAGRGGCHPCEIGLPGPVGGGIVVLRRPPGELP
jgi:hypothetical protein